MDVPLRGRLLVATPLLREPTFARTVILVLEHGADTGALGVVLNRPTPVAVSDVLPAVADLVSAPPVVFDGGPVGADTAIALGLLRDGADIEGLAVLEPPLVSVDLDRDPPLLAAALRELRVFAGYAGWSAGQLEGEVAGGSWYVVDSLPADPFAPDPPPLWSAVLRRQGWPLSVVAAAPLDPTMN